ncbi:hypothetical protein BCR34DRAFT_659478 [Clohesyomyces aquaticus]|uniref:Uncharacterized protein n=1 Tax=Clohesyomyces aquaticus TaxID=1231657 RepID=A0A1Y2AB20_9PLEO|nr:hypothetical protein BCR34DRAFT_659478 [Clohesyomyces aquaticus]
MKPVISMRGKGTAVGSSRPVPSTWRCRSPRVTWCQRACAIPEQRRRKTIAPIAPTATAPTLPFKASTLPTVQAARMLVPLSAYPLQRPSREKTVPQLRRELAISILRKIAFGLDNDSGCHQQWSRRRGRPSWSLAIQSFSGGSPEWSKDVPLPQQNPGLWRIFRGGSVGALLADVQSRRCLLAAFLGSLVRYMIGQRTRKRGLTCWGSISAR